MGLFAEHFIPGCGCGYIIFLSILLKSGAAKSWLYDIECEVTSSAPEWHWMSGEDSKLGFFDVDVDVDDENENAERYVAFNAAFSSKPETVISSVWIGAGETQNENCPDGYEQRCWWAVKSGDSASCFNSVMALCVQKKLFQYGSTAITDIVVRANKKGMCPPTPSGYERRGYWDVYEPSYSYKDSKSGHHTMAIYTRREKIRCHKCRGTEYVLSPCSGSTNTQCASCANCELGKYLSKVCTEHTNSVCKSCKKCDSNQYISKPCSPYQDTVCTSCSVCGKHQTMISPCYEAQDTVCADGVAYYYGVGMDRAVYRHLSNGNGHWKKITSGSVTQVKVVNSIIYGLGTDKAIYKWIGNSWKRITGGSVTRFVVSEGDIYGLGLDRAIWKSSVNGAKWNRITHGSVTDFTIFNGYFYGIGTSKRVWKHPVDGRGGWQLLTTGSVKQVQVVNNIIYGLGTDNAIYKWLRSTWARVTTGSVTSFIITGKVIHGVGTDKAIYKSTVDGARWTKITPGSVTDIVHTFSL